MAMLLRTGGGSRDRSAHHDEASGTAVHRAAEVRTVERFCSQCWGTLCARGERQLISSSATAGDPIGIASIFGGCYAVMTLTA
jgi:hypothetical protein